jgi:hypothetical protein
MRFLAITSLFLGLSLFVSYSVYAVENMPITPAADTVISPLKTLPAGFYQFNNLEIFKSPAVDEPSATIEVIQRNEKSCVVYENGKTSQTIPCAFDGDKNNNFTVQIDKETTLLGVNQESALLSDFLAGDKINVLGWLSADYKTIKAAMVRDLETKNYHQSFSGTIKNVTADGFTLVLSDGSRISVKTPIVEDAQITIKGVFDKVNNAVGSVLSILVKPNIVLGEQPAPTPTTQQVTPKKPSVLFKNFLKVFGL